MRRAFLVALVLSLAVHAGVLVPWLVQVAPATVPEMRVELVPPPPPGKKPVREKGVERPPRPAHVPASPAPATPPADLAEAVPVPPSPARKPAAMAAPAAPSAEEWQLASTYKLKNSKRYRHAWGRQVRSMMGTAVEGPDQGLVRFRIEIAPDGRLARVEELWSTSEAASKLAWQAIRSLPALPPTPTGKPLVFEQTIAFLPYETGWPPSYVLDCLPERAPFKNPFAWNASSSPQPAVPEHRPPPPEGCPPDSTAESIEEEERSMQRQMDQWRWGR
ncbi:energy transducer TonB [Parasulfuritortus cantonensis]|uniref:Energy transducer TonB n=1 Tax=Parasulfuritortus cantonensis TaxID=2528202 RepID=A0A4R1B7B9_9PROT|nr:energy transducer TonB [Parasulfuritortus cantonensis]